MNWLLVFVGAGCGGMLRHAVNVGAPRLIGDGFPGGTMAINVVGSLLIGVIAGWLAFRAGDPWSQQMRLFAVTGILGGFTTFSAFSLDTALLVERGEPLAALAYVGGSVGLSLLAVFAGLALIRAFA
ncbi:fluoride efflux transporter CrcB [Ancylobacter oerskovii]|uniref:Fluoride-specific ion channel FluC n=1 Tax=Ancylobacter oerskovii TaxID=459519 RepID=A0ABW4YYU7_9HYPH|nr:fluoride efflux transporter CrcB [Ancylobacter oerskovii]MBS7546401.1 fluoride efflux transporter CrcB [Ancylobacter oerskovii]